MWHFPKLWLLLVRLHNKGTPNQDGLYLNDPRSPEGGVGWWRERERNGWYFSSWNIRLIFTLNHVLHHFTRHVRLSNFLKIISQTPRITMNRNTKWRSRQVSKQKHLITLAVYNLVIYHVIGFIASKKDQFINNLVFMVFRVSLLSQTGNEFTNHTN